MFPPTIFAVIFVGFGLVDAVAILNVPSTASVVVFHAKPVPGLAGLMASKVPV